MNIGSQSTKCISVYVCMGRQTESERARKRKNSEIEGKKWSPIYGNIYSKTNIPKNQMNMKQVIKEFIKKMKRNRFDCEYNKMT